MKFCHLDELFLSRKFCSMDEFKLWIFGRMIVGSAEFKPKIHHIYPPVYQISHQNINHPGATEGSKASDLGVVKAYARSSLLAHELTTTSANDGHCGSGYCGRLHAFEFTWAWRMNLIHQKSVNFKCFHFINRFNSPKEEFRIFLPFKPFLVPRLGLLAFVHPTVNLRIRSQDFLYFWYKFGAS